MARDRDVAREREKEGKKEIEYIHSIWKFAKEHQGIFLGLAKSNFSSGIRLNFDSARQLKLDPSRVIRALESPL